MRTRQNRSPWAGSCLFFFPIVAASFSMGAAPSLADQAAEIQAICTTRWPSDEAKRGVCRERQHTAARELVGRVEAFAPGSREFTAAKVCIERATVLKPARIDWPRALGCFDTRVSASLPTDTP